MVEHARRKQSPVPTFALLPTSLGSQEEPLLLQDSAVEEADDCSTESRLNDDSDDCDCGSTSATEEEEEVREENTGLVCKRRGETRPMAVGVEVVQPISYGCFFALSKCW